MTLFLLNMLFRYGLLVVLIALTFLPIFSQWVRRWKYAQRRLDEMRRYEVGFGKPSEKTLLSMQGGGFHETEEEFAGLGFEVLGDYIIAGGTNDEVPLHNAPLASPFGADVKQEFRFAHFSACRVLLHREHVCIASISAPLSSTPRENRNGLHYLVASVGDGWTYTSHADLPSSVDLESSARELASFEGKIPPTQLLEAHLKRRAEIARAGEFDWEMPPSLEKIIEWEVARYARIREWASKRSPLALLRAERRKPRRELLGELRGKL